MKFFRIISYNILIFLTLITFLEVVFGYWFKSENFGIYMRKERKLNWKTESSFYGVKHDFFYKRNYWGFRGENFNPKEVKVLFEGGSTGNQRFTPEKLTIVGILNKKFSAIDKNIKIYNASTDGKSVMGYINDFKFWFPKIPNFKPSHVIFFIGVNDRFIDDRYFLDFKISETKIDQFKDYIKNNSYFVDKFKIVKNRFFPKNTLAYDFSDRKLYENFVFIDYETAKRIHKNKTKKNEQLLKKFSSKLNKLKMIIENHNIVPIFITQLMYDGLKDKELYLINEKLKEFANQNDYYLIALDEKLIMAVNDYYDFAHTTPSGSLKIAETIFPDLNKILKNYDFK